MELSTFTVVRTHEYVRARAENVGPTGDSISLLRAGGRVTGTWTRNCLIVPGLPSFIAAPDILGPVAILGLVTKHHELWREFGSTAARQVRQSRIFHDWCSTLGLGDLGDPTEMARVLRQCPGGATTMLHAAAVLLQIATHLAREKTSLKPLP